jgi:hypothetical protein
MASVVYTQLIRAISSHQGIPFGVASVFVYHCSAQMDSAPSYKEPEEDRDEPALKVQVDQLQYKPWKHHPNCAFQPHFCHPPEDEHSSCMTPFPCFRPSRTLTTQIMRGEDPYALLQTRWASGTCIDQDSSRADDEGAMAGPITPFNSPNKSWEMGTSLDLRQSGHSRPQSRQLSPCSGPNRFGLYGEPSTSSGRKPIPKHTSMDQNESREEEGLSRFRRTTRRRHPLDASSPPQNPLSPGLYPTVRPWYSFNHPTEMSEVGSPVPMPYSFQRELTFHRVSF